MTCYLRRVFAGMASGVMKLIIATLDDAIHALNHFHSFHDSVIKTLSLISHDTIESDSTVLCTGEIDVILDLLFYDLDRSDSLHGKVIRATFKKATDINIDFRGFKLTDWGISRIDITNGSSSSFILNISWNKCDEEKKWIVLSSRLFTFKSAVIEC